jgi:hypothetical protein
MTVGKASALAAGFVGAVALGVAIGPTVHDKWSSTRTVATDSAPAPEAAVEATPATPAPERVRRARPAPAAPSGPIANAPGSVSSVVVSVWEPELRDRVKSVLNKGTNLELAAEDFRTAEEFVTVAHAARNTSVPFVVLKHRVLNEGRTLADAIHEAKPELDAKAEVERARTAALSDLTA